MMLITYPDTPPSSQQFYHSQKSVQITLLVVAAICIPWMFVGKPIYTIVQRRKRNNVNYFVLFCFISCTLLIFLFIK